MSSKVALACLLALALARPGAAQTRALADEVEALRKRAAELLRGGDRQQAAAEYEKALQMCEQRHGKKHTLTAGVCLELGRVYHDLRLHARAQRMYLRCLEIREELLGKDHVEVAVALHDLGTLYRDLAFHEPALTRLQRSLAIKLKRKPADDPSIAQTRNTLGLVHLDLRQYPRAEEQFQAALKIRLANRKKDPLGVTQPLGSLAVLYRTMGQPERAEPLLLKSLAICEAERGKHDPSVAVVVHNLAEVQRALGRLEKAAELYRRALTIWEGRRDRDVRAQAQSLNNLGSVYVDLRRFKEARVALTRSLRLREETFGKEHLDVAESLSNLAGLCHVEKDYNQAEALFRRCLAIREARLGKDHPAVADTLNHLAMLAQRRGDAEQAARLLDRARQASRRHVSHALAALPEREHAALLAVAERRDFERALSLQPKESLFTTRSLDAVTRRAAVWLLNGKALGQEALARAALLGRDERDPALGRLVGRLRQKREELARLALAPPVPGQEAARQKRLDELRQQELDLARQLARAGSSAVAPAEWYELDQLHQALPAGSVLIDVARFRSFDYNGAVGDRWREPRYAVWLSFPNRTVRAVDLGPAAAIDDAVAQVRRALEGAPRLIRGKGDAAAYTQELQRPLERLSHLLLAPLLDHVGKTKRWIVSPDGDLWLVPWQILLLRDGKFAVQEHTLTYVLSGRDLLAGPSRRGKGTRPLVVADPDFDLGGKSSAPGRDPLRRAARLPSTRDEARTIAGPLKAYAGDAPRLLLGAEAQEGAVKSAKGPRVLVLATHGFFLPPPKLDLADARPEAGKARLPAGHENPLSRCGLLLAGCNHPAGRGDDGILTGLEVLGMDLHGCELVVLSACETGLGDVRHGEGVAGLRQAFRLAGAEAVVSSLWQVPSGSSAQLMTQFFRGLARGNGRAAALRAAQLELIESRLEGREVAHPFFWGAFTVTGRD